MSDDIFKLNKEDLGTFREYLSSEYPFESKFIDLSAGRIHYVDSGKGTPLVFVHGTPSWSFEWRHQITQLQSHFRCIALDHMGFGFSDRPIDFDYSFESHRKNFEEFIQKLGLKEFILIVHDVGGAIALPFAIQNPTRIKKLVVLNSWFWPFEKVDPKFEKQKKWFKSGLMKWLYLKMNFSPKMMIRMSWGKSAPLPKQLHRLYQAMFPTPESRQSTWKLVGQISDSQSYFDRYSQNFDKSLSKIPTLVMWGSSDALILPANLQEWRTRLPHATIEDLKKVGHFPQEEAHQQISERLSLFFGA